MDRKDYIEKRKFSLLPDQKEIILEYCREKGKESENLELFFAVILTTGWISYCYEIACSYFDSKFNLIILRGPNNIFLIY